MPRYLKEIEKNKDSKIFQAREDFITPWKNNLAAPSPSVSANQDIKRDIHPDINQVATRYTRDIHEIATRDIRDSHSDSNEVATRQLTRDKRDIFKDIEPDIERDIQLLRHYVRGLIGHQRKMFEYVQDAANLNDGFNSGFISSHEMARCIGCTYPTVKITLVKMVEKGVLIRHKGKGCRGGYIILEIPKIVKGFYIENQDIKPDTKRDILRDNCDSHYNSSNNNIIIGEGWDEIDCLSLEEISFGKNCLKQLKDCGANRDVVQASIHYYAFDRDKISKKEERLEKFPLKIIMGVLRKGNAWSKPVGYISPKEQTIRRIAEEKRAGQTAAEQAAKDLLESEFKAWEASLTEAEKSAIAPGRISYSELYLKLKAHFKANQWQEIKKAWS